MSRTSRLALVSLALAAACTLTVGCTSSKDKRVAKIRQNLTPELVTLYERQDDLDNNLAIYFNEMDRMFWQDLGRAWYTDRPSRLTPEPSIR